MRLLLLILVLFIFPALARADCTGGYDSCGDSRTLLDMESAVYDNRDRENDIYDPYGSGATYMRKGNVVYGSRGRYWQEKGSVTYGSDGTTCQRKGDVVYCY